jgi:hypothetical protein
MKKTATQPAKPTCDECFNCFKQGCRLTLQFQDPARKPLRFCGKLCVDAFIQDEMVPKLLESNQRGLDLMTQFLEELKVDPQLMVLKKSWVIEKMLRTALAVRKPKAELQRLYTLWQECATETLQKISDDKELEEVCALKWASAMKKHDQDFPSLIDALGR